MSTEDTHFLQIKDLVKAYGAQLTADLLGVSLRTINNYLRNDKPTTPHEGTLRKLQEIYSKHQHGIDLSKEKRPQIVTNNSHGSNTHLHYNGGDEANGKIISLLEKHIAVLESQLAEKDRLIHEKNGHIRTLENQISLSVMELQKQAVVNRAYQKTVLRLQDDILVILQKKPLSVIQNYSDKLLAEALAGGS